jgi:hypothetical protein
MIEFILYYYPHIRHAILGEIPILQYKDLRLVNTAFEAIVQLEIDELEKKCEREINMLREKIINWAFKVEIPHMHSEPEAYWPSKEAWNQQCIDFNISQPVGLSDFNKAQLLWLHLHDKLPRGPKFWCFYCMGFGTEEQLYKFPWTYNDHYARTVEQIARIRMRHYMHRNCYLHWRQWVKFHGKLDLMDRFRYCPVCYGFSPFEFHKVNPKDPANCFCVFGAKFGLLNNQFHLDP